MTRRASISYMQARTARMATHKWNLPISEIGKIFAQYEVFQHIRDCYDLYHIEGDEAIWESLRSLLNNRDFNMTELTGSIDSSVRKEDSAIDMLVSMVVEELAEKFHTEVEDILPEFLQSRTCATLYDRESKLWWDGPSHIAEMYLSEIKKRKKRRTANDIKLPGEKAVMKDSTPDCVLISPDEHLKTIDELEDARLIAIADERLAHFDPDTLVPEEKIWEELNITDENPDTVGEEELE